jgi:serine/threonine-protein kinase
MSQRFIRCVHCGLPHDVMQLVCPATGKAIDRKRINTSSIPQVNQEMVNAHLRGQAPHKSQGKIPAAASVAPIGMPANASTLPPPKAVRQLTGKTIGGKYLVRSVLGEGGMGTVFEAENLAIGRAVAVKVLHPAQARKKVAVKRFHQEARAAGAIGHPNICEVYDLGTLDDGSPYLVMEKLVGETLAERIASEGGLPFDDVIDVLTQVLSGLVAAHEKGIVHRDIKPENIFLTKRVGCPPVAKLLDFGVSKMISPVLSGEREEDLDLTRTGMVMGTPFYMSPEQARGDRNLDARVDLWACGVILYEALTGRRPYTAANYNALLLQILTTQPRPARELRPALPLGFDEVIEKSMARGRDERFQSAAEFQRELQSLRDRHPKTNVGMQVAELTRQAFSRGKMPVAASQPIIPSQTRPPPALPAQQAHAQRRVDVVPRVDPTSEPPLYVPEPTPSSVEIPVLFSETPLSGEQLPHLGTADVELLPSSTEAAAMAEDQPTEIFRARDLPDSDTTEQRSDLGHLAIGKRARAGNVRTPTNAPPRPVVRTPAPKEEFRQTDTDRDAKRDFRNTESDLDDNNATIVQPASAFLANIRRKPQKTSPDDTLRMDGSADDPRLQAPPPPEPAAPRIVPPIPRAPKMPR